MGVKATILVLIAVFSLAIVVSTAYAQEGPALSSFFYGKAKYNNKDVPAGSTVIAKIDGEIRGAIKVQQAGVYGSKDTDQKLGVSGGRSSINKQIEFFVKIPKLKEIKSTQKGGWLSGNVTELDLTFNGEEIFDNSTELVENKTKEIIVFNSLTAGKSVVAFIDNPEIPIIRLQLVTLKNLTNVTIEFEVVYAPDVTKLDNVYKYLWISAPKLKETDIKTAILRFKVSNEWLETYGFEPSTIKLYRYSNNRWNVLETFHEGIDEFDSYYRASTPGFSYFAIRAGASEIRQNINQTIIAQKTEAEAEKSGEKPVAEAEPEQAEQKNAAETVNQITGFAVQKVKSNPIIGVMLVLIGIFIGILATYFFVIGKEEKAVVKKVKKGGRKKGK